MTIPWTKDLIQVLFVVHAGTLHGFGQVKVLIFAEKMMGFPSDFVSILTKLSSGGHEKNHVTFFTGIFTNYEDFFQK